MSLNVASQLQLLKIKKEIFIYLAENSFVNCGRIADRILFFFFFDLSSMLAAVLLSLKDCERYTPQITG